MITTRDECAAARSRMTDIRLTDIAYRSYFLGFVNFFLSRARGSRRDTRASAQITESISRTDVGEAELRRLIVRRFADREERERDSEGVLSLSDLVITDIEINAGISV